jgi:hypothetical protein
VAGRAAAGLGWRLLIATAVEAAWEMLENSDAVIERYRSVTISLDYYGDSVINGGGRHLAHGDRLLPGARLPVWATVALILAFEASDDLADPRRAGAERADAGLSRWTR